MWLPPTTATGIATAILSLLCWGSWINFLTLATSFGQTLEHFYHDYSIAAVLLMTAYAFTLGSITTDDSLPSYEKYSVMKSLSQASMTSIVSALIAGVLQNVGNFILIVAVDLIGIAISFPLAVGTALVIGTALDYALQQSGDAVLLFTGTALGVIAVATVSFTHSRRERELEELREAADDFLDEDLLSAPRSLADGQRSRRSTIDVTDTIFTVEEPPPVVSKTYSLVLCLSSGVMLGVFSPLITRSVQGHHRLNVYSSMFLFSISVYVSSVVFLSWRLSHRRKSNPFLRPPPVSTEKNTFLRHHVPGVLGGMVWITGTLANSVAGQKIGFAVSYALGQAAPMVGALWGVLYWREFDGCGPAVKLTLCLVFVFYAGAIACIALAAD